MATARKPVEPAVNAAEEVNAEKKTEKAFDEKKFWNEKVPIKLFKDGHKYKDDLTVGVNGKIYKIRRGETVYVPRNVAEVIEQSMLQDNKTADMITRFEQEYKDEARKAGC